MQTVQTLLAQVYNGGGIKPGIDETGNITGVTHAEMRDVVISILNAVLDFLGLAGVIMIIIAGLYLILGMGEDESREKAKKIIQYTLIGLLVVLFSKIIVSLVTSYLAGQITS